MKYRSEIDGLRAFAVLPVILFHAGYNSFSGGFVGVDVFFVISGYLITRIIIEEIEDKRFNIINFYERRARRILPALFFIMFACIPFAWMWMLPDALENFGQSLVSTSLFSNNLLLMMTSAEYWELAAEYKPLLHTWSLGVEEQYYLLLPIFLIIFWRFGKSIVILMTLLVLICSLIYSELGWRNDPLGNFYFTLTRAWELLAGSIAAFIVLKRGIINSPSLAFAGLGLIIYAILNFNENINFPGLYTLVPVLGTVLIILYADKGTLIVRLLSLRIFVGIGLISYSLYLWHQPILALARIYKKTPITNIDALIILILTFSLAIFTWKFIEAPFRNKTKFSAKMIFLISSFCMIFFITAGLYMHSSNGAPNRIFVDVPFERSTHEIKVADLTTSKIEDFKSMSAEDENLLILGDSFAADIAYLIKHSYPMKDFKLIYSNDPIDSICNENLWDSIKPHNIPSIIFAFDEGFNIPCIGKVIQTSNIQGISLLFVGTKQFGYNMNWLARLKSAERKLLCQKPTSQKIEIDSRDSTNIPTEYYFSFLRTFAIENCFPITNHKGELLSSDRQHFTIAGVEYFAEKFFQDPNVRHALGIK